MCGCEVQNLCWVVEGFGNFNTNEILGVCGAILIVFLGLV